MLTTIGGAVFEWVVGEALGRGLQTVRRDPQNRELDEIMQRAVEPAVDAVTTTEEQRRSLVPVLRERLTARLDLDPGAMKDPATCIRRWLEPLGRPHDDGSHLSYWDEIGIDGDLVADALSVQVVGGISANARKGGSLSFLASEQRYEALRARLESIAAHLSSLTALRSSPAARRHRPIMTPARWGRHVSRPAAEREIARHVFAPALPGHPPMLLIWGTGGFGKTWLAQDLGLSPAALETFEGGVLWVQLSEDRSMVRLSAELEGLMRVLGSQEVAAGDPRLLAAQVGELTDGLPTLVVVDDAWTEGQVEPFVESLPPQCFRIVTSRNQRAVPPHVPRVHVDTMRPGESAQLLRGRLAITDDDLIPLLDFCGDWPLILALVGGQLQWVVDQGGSTADAVSEVRRRLSGGKGLRAFDGARRAEPASPRTRTVEATMETSLRFLEEREPGATARYLELAAFQEDLDVPREVVADLWRERAGLDAATSEALLFEFAGMSLVQRFQFTPPTVRLHDVVRAYLRHAAGPRLIAEVSRNILDLYHGAVYDYDEDDDDDGPYGAPAGGGSRR
ncbi:NB-ARC domain-containing protein [Streptosporangium sp. NPDC023825]|uniref:NB-ARC domain-containing protein n=1 Tax=Streptosporangium sp. NPDC023825 TaxID=3154909 RepID=UPI003421391B